MYLLIEISKHLCKTHWITASAKYHERHLAKWHMNVIMLVKFNTDTHSEGHYVTDVTFSPEHPPHLGQVAKHSANGCL